MAYVGKLEKIEKDKLKKHEEVRSTYSIFRKNNEKILQIDTYGSQNRERKDKVSQTIQIDLNTIRLILEKENFEKKYLENLRDKKNNINFKILYKHIIGRGFKYREHNLYNFYLSLKSKPFVILAGISGTGKSKLVELFAEAIGAEKQYNIISVKPDWTDSTELLGYKDIKGEFIPGILTNIILEARKNIDKPYFVCLDEMNLARVEYYLGEYLSLIESRYRDIEGRICTKEIFRDGYFSEESKYNRLYFPENLYIIGTVNMDDTTFGFSKKVLDRANTIEFSEADLEDLSFLEVLEDEIENLNCDNSLMKTNFLNLKEIWTSEVEGKDRIEIQEYVKKVNKKIVEIQEILKKYSRHFAFRVRDEIVIYMTENKIANLLDENIAFDFQFMQKILPIISGSDESVRKILIDLLKLCFEEEANISYDDYLEIVEKKVMNENIKYKLSANKIVQMLRGYENGYASYWI